jgi:hypothetical protein
MSSFLSPGGRATSGLFGVNITPEIGPLSWSRPQQAAFLILFWNRLKSFVVGREYKWAETLLKDSPGPDMRSAPFSGDRTMLNQEQGVRGVLAVGNDLFLAVARNEPQTFSWESSVLSGVSTTEEDVTVALGELKRITLANWIDDAAEAISSFDWRSADAPGLDDEERLRKRAFRGSGGYVALREQLLKHIAQQRQRVAPVAGALAGQRA